MSNISPLNAASTVPASGSSPPAPAQPVGSVAASSASQAPGGAASNQRLIIKEGAQAGVLIYTVLDRTSGEIVVQIPREMVIKLGSRDDYSAGQIISTEA